MSKPHFQVGEFFIYDQPDIDFGLGALVQGDAAFVLNRQFAIVHKLAEIYTARAAMLLLLDLGLESELRAGALPPELCSAFHPNSHRAVEWLLAFAECHDLLDKSGGLYLLREEPDLDLESIRHLASVEVPGHEAVFRLVDAVRKKIAPFFTGGALGEALLFDQALFPIWLEYFRNENLVYRINNFFPMVGIRKNLLDNSTVLELGGGVGSFVQMLAQDAKSKSYSYKISQYLFSDISPTFLRTAQRNFPSIGVGFPLKYKLLNINKSLVGQGIEPNSLDIVVAVNVLHVADRLPNTLSEIRTVLKPGGRLVFGECLKPQLHRPIYIEFFFQFMSSFTNVSTDGLLRPVSGFLESGHWIELLKHSGYSNIEEIPITKPIVELIPTFYAGAFSAQSF
jgi:SAM-dependent methyltransferase